MAGTYAQRIREYQPSTYDYSERMTIVNDRVKRLVWMPVYESKLPVYNFMSDDSIEETVRLAIKQWRDTAEAHWIYDHVSEDVRTEMHIALDYGSFEEQLWIKIMARFYEEEAVIYTLKWK